MNDILDILNKKVLIRVEINQRLMHGFLAVRDDDSNFGAASLDFLLELRGLVPKRLHYQHLVLYHHNYEIVEKAVGWGTGSGSRNCTEQLYALDNIPGSLVSVRMAETNMKLLMLLSFLLIELRHVSTNDIYQQRVMFKGIINRLSGFITEQRNKTLSYVS